MGEVEALPPEPRPDLDCRHKSVKYLAEKCPQWAAVSWGVVAGENGINQKAG